MATRPSNNEVKALIASVEKTDEQLAKMTDVYENFGNNFHRAVEAIVKEEVITKLQDYDVDEVNRDKSGIRINTLRSNGIESIYDVNKASIQDLEKIDGISKQVAIKIKTIAREIYDETVKSINIKISPDDKNEDTSAVLYLLFLYKYGFEFLKGCKEIYRATHHRVESTIQNAKPATSTLGWMFASKTKKDEALKAFNTLENLAHGKYHKDANDLFKFINEVNNKDYWSDFVQNSASYYALLEQLGYGTVNEEGIYSGLSLALKEEIENVQLDLTGLKYTLRSYQKFGVQYTIKQGQVLLGDEMGLGKTVQAIAAMVALRNNGETHFMVVCPAAVLINWAREITQASDLVPIKIHGHDFNAVREWVQNGGVAVTTYETISKFDLDPIFKYGMLVADEAHYVKNPNALRTKSLIKMRQHTDRALLMTGTPIENNVDEMCFLINMLQPKIGQEIKHIKHLSKAKQFKEKISPVYFRRTREDVLTELPDKQEIEQWVSLNSEEKEQYKKDVYSKNFMAMRQVSWRTPDVNKSSKGEALLNIIEQAKEEDRKVIVFSFFTDTINQVKTLLGDEICSAPINGAMSPKKRQETVDAFKEAPAGSVLLAQIQAGGTGLNIQSASVVVLCEPQIKPSIENQAISRAYRMGQVRNVLVYRLLCENTVDEQVMKILAEKQEIFNEFADESVSGQESLIMDENSINIIINQEMEKLEKEEKA